MAPKQAAAKPAAAAAKPAPAAAPAAATSAAAAPVAKQGKPRNYDLGNGIVRFSRTKMFHKKARYLFLDKVNPKTAKTTKVAKPSKPVTIVKTIGGEKNGGTRTVLLKKRKAFYPTKDKPKKRSGCKTFSKHVRNIRPNLTPGTVLILVAGRHAGKRVILLGVLPSGMLVVTGPFQFNSCPVRRMSQLFVIGTSTRVELGADFKLPEHMDDSYFNRNKKSTKRKVKRKDGDDIFAPKREKYVPSEQRKEDQKKVDAQVVEAIGKRTDRKILKAYLKSSFGLRSSQFPHRLTF